MRVLDNELKDKKIVYKKLLEYGFVKEKNFYIYQTKLLNNQFEMLVIVKENKMSSKLIDLESNKEYFKFPFLLVFLLIFILLFFLT